MNLKRKHHSFTTAKAVIAMLGTAMFTVACSTVYDDKTVYNDIEIPFHDDFRTDTELTESCRLNKRGAY